MVILDIECYINYFLISFKHLENQTIKNFELYDGHPLAKKAIARLMDKHTTISFNGYSYDLPLLTAALTGFNNTGLKNLSDSIIKSNKPSYKICRENYIDVPKWDHIDIIDIAPGKTSLKIYGGRLNCEKMHSLPIPPDAVITPEQREQLKIYCKNDLDVTELLYRKLLPAIDLRIAMSEQYGMDLRSKSDPQIAETVIKSELKKITGKTYYPIKVKDDAVVKYLDPGVVSFESQQLKDIFKRVTSEPFGFAGNGAIKLPNWLRDTKIKIGQTEYQMGIGGLHSLEKCQLVAAGDGLLFDIDVASYYPSIILQQRLSPDSVGEEFLTLYQNLVTRRLLAKKQKDMITANSLKIVLNSVFGKLGSKYSAFYAPALLLQTTMTGQLSLLMLIEQIENIGVAVKSANTDGIVCKCTVEQEHELATVIWNWELATSFELERNDYNLLASRDVNNYVAITKSGSFKGKGVFAKQGLQKNPDRSIVPKAVARYLLDKTPLEETIKASTDISEFVTVRKVQGGAVWRGELLGNAIRYYSSYDVSFMEHIEYEKNSNKVPKSSGCKPLLDFPDTFPDDVDYKRYIIDAKKLLEDVGYVGT